MTSSSARATPDFVVIGAQRCGTTTLYAQLREHPQVFIPEMKELNFFIDGPWRRLGRSWYEGLFAAAQPDQLRGDVSPSYSMFPTQTGAVEHLAAEAPDVRLVYAVRDPLERMRSAYLMMRREGHERRPIDTALRHDLRYLSASLYGLQVTRYLQRFPPEQLLVVVLEELERDPGAELDRVLVHLGLPPGWRPAQLARTDNANEGAREPRTLALRALDVARRRGLRRWGGRDLVRNRWTSRPLDTTVRSSPAVVAALEELLAQDLRVLCDALGWPTDPWGRLSPTEPGARSSG